MKVFLIVPFCFKKGNLTGNVLSVPFKFYRAGFSKTLRLEVMNQFHNAFTIFPSIERMTSPLRNSAFSAGLSGLISCITNLLSLVFVSESPDRSSFPVLREEE